MKETKEIKINIDREVLKKLEEIAEYSKTSVSEVIVSEVCWFIDRRKDENDRPELDSFNERGFERPLLNGEILTEVDGWLIGWMMTDEGIVAEKWNSDGESTHTCYNLTPIRNHWYDDPLNFPVRLIKDTEQYVTYWWVYTREDFIKAHREGFKPVIQKD